MLIKDIVCQMLCRLGLESQYDTESIESDEDEEISLMVRCINMTAANLASCEMPLIATRTLNADNGVIGYEQFNERVIDVKKAEDANGGVSFRMFPEYIRLGSNGRVTLSYSYLPKYAAIDEEVEVSPKATPEAVCLGAMSEYCIIKGRYEEGLIYEKRYKSLTKELSGTKREIVLPLRRW